MSNISGKLNFRQLLSHVMNMKGKNGDQVRCLIIPIKENHLVEGEKGVYLDFTGFEIAKEKRGDRKDTHLVKQSLPKEVYETMTDDQKQQLPILGNLIVWGFQEPSPREFEMGAAGGAPEEDDLPF